MKRRNLILLLGGTGSAALSTGTGAFSSASADRSVEVSVVEDENAYVGYEALPGVADGNENNDENDEEQKHIRVEDGTYYALVRVLNQFPGSLGIKLRGIDFAEGKHLISDFGVALSTDDDYEVMGDSEVRQPDAISGSLPSDSFTPGSYADIVAKVDGSPGKYHLAVTVRVKGVDSSVSAEVFGDTREFTLIRPVEGVTFNGTGNADTTAGGTTLEAEAWFAEENSGDIDTDDARVETGIHWDTSKKLKHSMSGSDYDTSGKLVAVRFPETEQTFVHPNYDVEDNELPNNWGSGAGQEVNDGSFNGNGQGS
jgi:hypothetical protein